MWGRIEKARTSTPLFHPVPKAHAAGHCGVETTGALQSGELGSNLKATSPEAP